jgi:hypothetical protein
MSNIYIVGKHLVRFNDSKLKPRIPREDFVVPMGVTYSPTSEELAGANGSFYLNVLDLVEYDGANYAVDRRFSKDGELGRSIQTAEEISLFIPNCPVDQRKKAIEGNPTLIAIIVEGEIVEDLVTIDRVLVRTPEVNVSFS